VGPRYLKPVQTRVHSAWLRRLKLTYDKIAVKFLFQIQVAAVQPAEAGDGRAVQVESIETLVQSAYGSSVQN
jgi:hypothetical protein